jgi:hypothetical protein
MPISKSFLLCHTTGSSSAFTSTPEMIRGVPRVLSIRCIRRLLRSDSASTAYHHGKHTFEIPQYRNNSSKNRLRIYRIPLLSSRLRLLQNPIYQDLYCRAETKIKHLHNLLHIENVPSRWKTSPDQQLLYARPNRSENGQASQVLPNKHSISIPITTSSIIPIPTRKGPTAHQIRHIYQRHYT